MYVFMYECNCNNYHFTSCWLLKYIRFENNLSEKSCQRRSQYQLSPCKIKSMQFKKERLDLVNEFLSFLKNINNSTA